VTNQARSYAPPGGATPDQLFRAWRDTRDSAARAELIERFLPLARKLAARYAQSGEPFDDLVQVASVGLIKAVERFDPEQGNGFAAYAVPTIVGELKRHFRDTTWALQVDRRAQERARAVRAAQRVLEAIGRTPTVPELAEFLDIAAEEVLEGLQASLAYSAVSLDAPVGGASGADGADGTASLFEIVGGDDERLDHAESRVTLRNAARHLPKLERRILYLRYGEDLSQQEIADQVGVSQMHVSRLLRRALAGLREQLGPI
jgi:RNA polymerase sigma-B factor